MSTDNISRSAVGSGRLNQLFLGLTAIVAGYFLIWLPGPSVGLQLIGIELGEWIKFLGIGSQRNWFYLPPIVAGMTIALLAAMWPNDRVRTWLSRGLAVAVAMLAFPAIAAIQLEPRSEWLARLLLIGLVLATATLGGWWGGRIRRFWIWAAMAITALVGLILPTFAYIAVRPVVEAVLLQSIGIGPGVLLNAVGSTLVAGVATFEALRQMKIKKAAIG